MVSRKTKCLLTFVLLVSGINLNSFAQQPCASAVSLSDVTDFCSLPNAFNNTTSIPSKYTSAACWTNVAATQDRWIKFTAIATDLQIVVITGTTNGTIKNVNLSLMRDCITAGELACTKATNDTTKLYKGGLTPGTDYYIRIASTASEAGTFKLCIDNYNPALNPQADCYAAVKLCDKSPIYVAGLSGIGNIANETVGEGTCFGDLGEHNNCWYYWVCGTSGTLTFDLKPNDGVSDLDFVLYSINSGSNVCSPRTVERCSATSCSNPFGMTGLNLSDSDLSEKIGCDSSLPASERNGYVKYLDMIAGKTYAILINNAKTNVGFTLTFGGTGQFEGPLAKITADKLSICEGQSILYTSNSTNYTSLDWNFTSGNGSPSSPTGTGPYTVGYNIPGKFVAILNATAPGCKATDYINITVNPIPLVGVASTEVCAGDQTTLKAITFLKGGTYVWSPGGSIDSSLVILTQKDTTYMVTYTKAGCSASAMGNVTVLKLPVVMVNSETICKGSSVTLTAGVKEAIGTYSYLWSTGATTPSISVSPTVTSSYTVTATSAQGCVGKGIAVVTLGGNLSVKAGNDTTICSGDTVSFQVSPNGTGYSYKWFASSGSVSNTSIYNPTASPVVNTTYVVEVTNDKGCVGLDSVNIFINPAITATFFTTSVSCKGLCDGKSAVIANGGTPPYTYNWTNGATTANCTQLCAGTYTVAVIDQNGCRRDLNALITEPPSLDLQTTSISSNCGKPTGSATVIISGGTIGTGYTYAWNDQEKQTTATASKLLNKQYCVTVTDGNGCKATACLTVSNTPGPQASLLSTATASCYGSCNGAAAITATGGELPYRYSWNTLPVQGLPQVIGLCAGDYIATVMDNAGCTDTVHVTIIQPSPVTIDFIAPVTICNGNTVTIKANAHGGDGVYTYNWQPELTDTTSSVIVFPLSTTVYHVVVKDGKGCTSTHVSILVNVNKPVNVLACKDVIICQKDSAKISAIASGGAGGYTYAWFPGAMHGNAINVRPLITTTYTISVKDSCGSIAAIDSVTVHVNPLPTVEFTVDISKGCSPLNVLFVNSSSVFGSAIVNWRWDFGDGGFSDNQYPTHVFIHNKLNKEDFTIGLTVTSSCGCKATLKKQKMIQLYTLPEASFDVPGATSMLKPHIHFTNNSLGANSWSWKFGDSLASAKDNKSTLFDPDHIYSDAGKYCIQLLVKNEGGCKDSVTECITIAPQFTLYVPNAFTPNDDGDNDEFVAKGEYINEFEIRIFNRWGLMFYYSNDISKGWNGRINNVGEEVMQDIYVYEIRIRDVESRKYHYEGTVALIKGI